MKLILVALLLAVSLSDPQPPVLPEQFTAEFEESSALVVIGITDGIYYHDAPNNR